MSPLLAICLTGMITFIPPARLGIRILHACHSDSQIWKTTSSGAWIHISSYLKHPGLPPDDCGIFTQQVVCPGTPAFNSLMSCFHCTPNTLISFFASHLWIQNFNLIKTWPAFLFSVYLLLGREPNLKSWSLLGTEGDSLHIHMHRANLPFPTITRSVLELMFFSFSHYFKFVQLTHCHQLHSCCFS